MTCVAVESFSIEFDDERSFGDHRKANNDQFERRYISWLLERHKDNLSAAAREARMDRKHLFDLARKHGLR